MTNWRGWAGDLVAGIAETIKAQRKTLGITAAELAERTAVGKPLTRAVISDIETGRKKTLDISELFTLAAALDVPPLGLLFPNVLDDMEVLPAQTVRGTNALGWFTGTGGGRDTSDDLGIQLALQLVSVERTLAIQRHNLAHHEKGLELASVGHISMVEGMEKQEEQNVKHARERVKLLEEERDRLLSFYRRSLEIRRDGA